jgi:hypothetical protein
MATLIGKNRTVIMGDQGQVQKTNGPDYSFLYDASTEIDPKWFLGDKVVLPDGREFRYCKCGATMTDMGFACYSYPVEAYGNAAIPAAAAAGASQITVTAASATLNLYRGGYIIIWATATQHVVMTRQIIGNTAADASNLSIFTLDAPINVAIDTASKCEIYTNPFSDVRTGNTGGLATFLGPANVLALVNQYFWVQTKGFGWLDPQAAVAAAAYVRSVYYRHDGSLDVRANIGTYVTDQFAGFTIGREASAGQDAPLIHFGPL